MNNPGELGWISYFSVNDFPPSVPRTKLYCMTSEDLEYSAKALWNTYDSVKNIYSAFAFSKPETFSLDSL